MKQLSTEKKSVAPQPESENVSLQNTKQNHKDSTEYFDPDATLLEFHLSNSKMGQSSSDEDDREE